MGEFVQQHPHLSTFFTFLFILLPQWLSAVWSLVSSEPLSQAIARKLMERRLITNQPQWWYPYTVTFPIGLVMFLWIASNESPSEPTAGKPSIQQHSKGSNSPNIVGDNNIVNIINLEDPKQLEKLANLLKSSEQSKIDQNGERHVEDPEHPLTREKLKGFLKKYPLGYVVFDHDYSNHMIPYSSREFMDNYELDWRLVKYENHNDKQYKITLPNIKLRDSGAEAKGIDVIGPKEGLIYSP